IPDADPAADFVGTGMFLPSNASSGLVIEAVNTPQVNLQVDRVFPNNLFTMLSEYGWDIFENSWGYSGVSNSLGGTLFEDTLSTEGELNQTVRLPVSLANTFDTTDRGLYKVNLSMGDGYGTNRWLILTDIGLVAKRDENSFLVWAVSNTTLQPLPSIRLTLVSDKNQQLARATTSQTGTATLNIPSETAKGTVFMILAEGASNDFTFLLPDRFGVDTTGLDVTGATASPSGLKAFLYGERDLYRPGETFKGMAIVRKGDLSAPEQMPLILIQRDPKGREIRRLRLDTSSQGTAAIELPIPDYTLTGGHTLELLAGDSAIGTMDFKVEEFVPDRIKVELTTDSDSVALGQTYEVNVQSNYLFGPPAAELPVTAHAVLRQTPFVAKGFEDYAFGNPDMLFEPQEFFSQDATLDTNGHTVFSLTLPGGLTPPAALEATVYGRVSESGGRGVTARKSVIVHPYSYYVGLKKLDKNGYEYNKPINFDFVTTDPKGIPCAHGELQARLYQDRWRTVVRKSPSGGYRYESVNDPQLLTATNIPAATGKGNVQFTPPGYGSYRVEVVSPESGASARASFYCGGWGYSPWALENPARIELVTDREQYRPGETATIQVRAPFAGRLLVAVESDKVLDTRVITLDGNTGEVSFPVKASYAPNVHVTALLVRKASDVSEGSVGRAFGALPLLVDNLSNKMPMTLSGPDEIRPESELTVVVDAEPGAVVTVAAVDEGIMQLSGSDDPTPFDFFYARRALGVESYDTFAMLYPDLARIMGKATAGGGAALLAESQFMRTEGIRRIIPVSFWSGPLTAGADGKVRYRMRLPDFQGALRVVAVGQDGKRFGTARTMTRVRSPLAVTPTLPRFLATGDSIEMPITLRNDMGREAPVTVTLHTSGAVESTAKPVTVQLADGGEETILLPLTAKVGLGGAATITVTATSGAESRRVVTELPVRPALPFRRVLALGGLSGEESQMAAAAEDFEPDTILRTVTLGRLPLVRFSGKLEHLLGYPHGCAEQTTSKAFPLIRFDDLARTLAPKLIDKQGPAFMVQSAIMRLRSMQTDDGGFAFWPGEETPDPWVSAYVTHFLLEAGQAGFNAPGMQEPAQNYMAILASQRKDMNACAYALFNLAKAGMADRGSMDELRDKRLTSLTPLARTLLACAYSLAGDAESFNVLLKNLPEIKTGRDTGGRMGSELRDSSLMLLALMDVNPEDILIPKLAAQVSQLMSTDAWGTTQENALAFAALGKVLQQADTGPIS
ncbi:MAG: alpha-2-macroglobulin family protein, partial [Proteobacteria bacterium]|nr:alpha-2-macroglobulin family protein [Pseudomonadota bacterium]